MNSTIPVVEQLINKIKMMRPEQQQRLLEMIDDGSLDAAEEEIPSSDPQEGQRQHARKSYFMSVDYAVKDRCFRDFIKDISAGGVFIETHHLFPVGETIALSFMVPRYPVPVKITGKIARVSPEGLGIEFLKENEDLIKELKMIINSL
jgi:Tfp pilus assembly protein PilZ